MVYLRIYMILKTLSRSTLGSPLFSRQYKTPWESKKCQVTWHCLLGDNNGLHLSDGQLSWNLNLNISRTFLGLVHIRTACSNGKIVRLVTRKPQESSQKNDTWLMQGLDLFFDLAQVKYYWDTIFGKPKVLMSYLRLRCKVMCFNELVE